MESFAIIQKSLAHGTKNVDSVFILKLGIKMVLKIRDGPENTINSFFNTKNFLTV